MSYAMAGALQAAVFAALSEDGPLAALVGDAIYDAVPAGALPQIYVSLGPETVRAQDDVTGRGAAHRFSISVATDVAGFQRAKTVAGAVCDALHEAPLTLARGRLVSLRFEQARAGRIDKATGRRIDLTFRARVEDD